jgi:hypothetical protein
VCQIRRRAGGGCDTAGVQTFLPCPAFDRSARLLDQRRLGKQRVEALQVLRGLTVPGYGWRHHPAVRMWRGYEEALVCYGVAVCREWVRAGFRDTCEESLKSGLCQATGTREPRGQQALARAGELPPWLGDPDFHRSHQSALLRKDPAHYGRFFPGVPDDLPYVWPSSDRG